MQTSCASMPPQCQFLQKQRINSMMTSIQQSRTCHQMSFSFCLETSMQDWGVTETLGQPAWVIIELERWMKMDSSYWNFAANTTFVGSNSFFQTKPYQKVSWRHPRSVHWHQLDLINSRHQSLNSLLITHSYHSADSDMDHSLVCLRSGYNQWNFIVPEKKLLHTSIPATQETW